MEKSSGGMKNSLISTLVPEAELTQLVTSVRVLLRMLEMPFLTKNRTSSVQKLLNEPYCLNSQ